jgi:hypothetical protein
MPTGDAFQPSPGLRSDDARNQPSVAESADNVVRMIIDKYALPNKSLPEVAKEARDSLRNFSEACHDELAAVTPS